MSTQNIIRAWKDESYRASLSEAERAALPANPAGVIALPHLKLSQTAYDDLTDYLCPISSDCTPSFACSFLHCTHGCPPHPQVV
jgi:mersacidin/lichenicidin family type 2 lantibiotic